MSTSRIHRCPACGHTVDHPGVFEVVECRCDRCRSLITPEEFALPRNDPGAPQTVEIPARRGHDDGVRVYCGPCYASFFGPIPPDTRTCHRPLIPE